MHFAVPLSSNYNSSIFIVRPKQQARLLATHLLRELLSLRLHILDRTRHVERRLRQRIMQARDDLPERADGVLQRDELSLVASENLSDLERLRHETLDLTRALDSQLVLLGQLVHTENGNDILERLVVLKNLLDGSGDLVVLRADLQ